MGFSRFFHSRKKKDLRSVVWKQKYLPEAPFCEDMDAIINERQQTGSAT